METTDFLAFVKTEVLAQEDEELPVIDFDPPPDANPGYVVAAELLDVPIVPVDIKIEQGTINEKVTVWNVAIPHENTVNSDNNNTADEDTLFIDEHENDPDPGDPDFQPGSDNESDDLTTYADHDYTPMAGVDPSSLTHIEILDCQQDKKKGYNCPHCLYTTRRYHHFQSHIVCHSDEKPFHCNKCDFSTARKMALVTHAKYKHSDVKIKCEKCEFTTKHSSSLKLHMKLHSEEKKFSCPRCDFTTKHWHSLKSHLVQHTDIKALKCQYCDFRTKHAASLRYHLKVHASERAFKCDQCVFTATSASNLQQHKLCHTDVRPFPCELCSLKFKSSWLLKTHVKAVHLNVKPYKCKLCPKRFCNSGNLRRHQIVHGGPKKLFECPDCHVEFTLESNLKRHLKKHDHPVSYRCRLCHHTFSELSNLHRHINTVHLRAIQLPCPYCHKTLTTSTTLRRHIKTFHPERWSTQKGMLKVNKFVKKSAVTKTSVVASQAGLSETLCAEGEVGSRGGSRRTVLPRNETECTIIEPEYDAELIDMLPRLDTSPEVAKKYKKKKALQTKTLTSPGEPKKGGRPPNPEKLKLAVKGKICKMTKLEIRKPLPYANKSKCSTGKLVKKSLQQLKAMKVKGNSKINSGDLSGSPKKKRGLPAKVQNSTLSSRKSGNAGTPVKKKLVPKKATPSKTSSCKKRGHPEKIEATTLKQGDGAEEVMSETTVSLNATPAKKRGRPKKSTETASSLVVEESIEAENVSESDTSMLNPSPSFITLVQPVKKRMGRPPKNRPPVAIGIPAEGSTSTSTIPAEGSTSATGEISAEENFIDTSTSNPSPSFMTLDPPLKKRRGRPPKNRRLEIINIPEADIVYEADIPVGSTYGEISARGNFRSTTRRNSEREGLFDFMIPLTMGGEGACDELSADDDNKGASAVECVPDADHLYAAPPETSVTPTAHPAFVENYGAQTTMDNEQALDVNNAEIEQLSSVSTVEIKPARLASDSLDKINQVLSKSPIENEILVMNPTQAILSVETKLASSESRAEAEPTSRSSQDKEQDSCVITEPMSPGSSVNRCEQAPSEGPIGIEMEPMPQETPAETELTPPAICTKQEPGPEPSFESDVPPLLIETPVTVENAVLTFTKLEGNLSTDFEEGTPTEVGTIPKEQSRVMEYFGLQRKLTESEKNNLQISQSVVPDENNVVEADESIITGIQQIESPDFTFGTMRVIDPAPFKAYEGISSLLRQAMIKNKIKGRPWITGTAKDRQRYLQEKAQMASKKTRGRPPKKKRPGRPKGSKNGIKPEPSHSETTTRLGRPKGSKDGILTNTAQSLRKSGRQPKASQKMLESNSGVLYNMSEKRNLSEKFQKMIDSLINETDGDSESFAAGEAANSDVKKGKWTVRKSRRALTLSAKKRKMGFDETGDPVSDSEDEDPPQKKARLAKDNQSPKKGKTLCLGFSARNGKGQKTGKSSSVTRIKGKSLQTGLGPKKKKEKLKDIDSVKMSGRRSLKGTPSKGMKKGPLNSTTLRKVRWDKGLAHKNRKQMKEKLTTKQSLKQTSKQTKQMSKQTSKQAKQTSKQTKQTLKQTKQTSKQTKQTLKQTKKTSKQTSSAAGSSDQSFCMVQMKDFANLLQAAGKVVYVLPADSQLGQLAAASNSVMCLVPQSDSVVIPPGAIPVQAVSNSSVGANKTTSASKEKHSEPIHSNKNVGLNQADSSPRMVRSDKGKGKMKGPQKIRNSEIESDAGAMASEHESEFESSSHQESSKSHKVRLDTGIPRKVGKSPADVLTDGGTLSEVDLDQTTTESCDIKKQRKPRSDQGVPRKLGKSPSQANSFSVLDVSDTCSGMDSSLSESCNIKKPRKERSDKGVPRKHGKSPGRSDQQSGHAEAESLTLHLEPNSGAEHSGIFLDPRECLSFNASSQKPRKVRSDKGISKATRKRTKGKNETDMGTVIKKKSGRPKMIQTSKDSIEESSTCIEGSAVGIGTSSTVDLKDVSGAKRVGRPRKAQKTLYGQESSADTQMHFEDSAMSGTESSFTPQISKRFRKPKFDEDYVNLEDSDFEECDSEQDPFKIHNKGRMPSEHSTPVEKVVKKRGRPPKNTSQETSDESAAKWMKVTISPDGVVTSSGIVRGRTQNISAPPAVLSPILVEKSMTGKPKKHTARKSFPQPDNSLPTGISWTSSLYSDIFPGGGVPVPVMEINPMMSQLTHAGSKNPTSTLSESDTAVIALSQSDPSVQEELVYVDLVMDQSLGESQQFTFLAAETDGIQGTLVSGIEYEVIDAPHLQPLLD